MDEVGSAGGLDLVILFPIVVVTVLVGIMAGSRLARVVSPSQARAVALTLAGLGALGALIRGILQVAAG